MTRIQTKSEINKIKQILIDKYKPERIVLFGSFAWGKPNQDSDLDFLIIKKVQKPRPAREQEVYRVLSDYHYSAESLPVDIIVHTPDEAKKRLSLGDPFIKEILTRGQVIYEKT